MNKKNIFIMTWIIVMTFIPGCAFASSSEIKKVQKDVVQLLKTKNVNTVIRMTWPGFWKQLGGVKKARKLMSQAIQDNTKMGLVHKDIRFPNRPTFLKSSKTYFVVIPYKSKVEIKALNRIYDLTEFYIGARKSESHRWKYIDGASLSMFGVRSYFPDFPQGVSLPKGGLR